MTDRDIEEKVDKLNFAVEKSMRYHQRMRGFCERYHRFNMFLIIIFGSAAFSKVFDWSEYLGAAAAVLAAIELVWGLSHRARDHGMLHRRFSDLAIDIRTTSPSSDSYEKWVKERINIEADEQPIYWALEADCDNEVRRAWGKDKELVQIGWWARLTMYWLRQAETAFEVKPFRTSGVVS